MHKIIIAILLAYLYPWTIAAGQGVDTLANRNRRMSVSANVLGIATLNPTIDIEYRVMKKVTVGGTVWWEVFEIEDRWAQCKVSWYPGKETYRGLGLSVTGGFHNTLRNGNESEDLPDNEIHPTFGGLISYTWRVGRQKRLLIFPVTGYKQVIGEQPTLGKEGYFEARINLGWLF